MADEPTNQKDTIESSETDSALELATLDLNIELPNESLFSLDDYLQLYNVGSTRVGFSILTLLETEKRLSTSELSDALDRESNKLHYHLRKLKRTGLIRNRRDPSTGTEDTYSYYMLTELGQTVLTHGVKTGLEKLAAEEYEIQQRYAE